MKTSRVLKTKYRQAKVWSGILCLLCFLPFLMNARNAAAGGSHPEEIYAMGAKPQRLASPAQVEGNPLPPEQPPSPPPPQAGGAQAAEKNFPAPVKAPEKGSAPAAAAEKNSLPPAPAAEKAPVEKNPSLPAAEKNPATEKSPLPQPADQDSSPPAPVEQGTSSPLKKDSLPAPLPDQGAKKKLGYHHYSYASSFGGSGMGGGSFDHPVAAAVDSQDNIYVVDQGNNLIQKLNQNGDFICEWGKRGTKPGEFDSPSAIAIDKKDIVYVVDTNNNRIQKIDPGKTDQAAFTSFGSLGSGEGKFQTPSDIVIDGDNAIYVVDSRNSRIQKFDSDGKFLKEFGSYGSCRECFLAPSKIAYDPTGFGYLYVLDQNRKDYLLQKIDTSGRFLRALDVFHSKEYPVSKPAHIYFDADGFLYVVDQEKGSVYKFNADGEFIQKIGDPSSRETALNNPQSVVQDSDKRLLIVDTGSNRIKIFDQM